MRSPGLIMKIRVGFSLWITITIIFFRWYNAEEHRTPARRVSRDLDRELMGLQPAMTEHPDRRTRSRRAPSRGRPTPRPGRRRRSSPGRPPRPSRSPFWQRRYVERYLVPLVLPIAVVVGLVAYVLNISRVFLSAHGHIPVIVGSVITVMILLGATLLSAGADGCASRRSRSSSAAFILVDHVARLARARPLAAEKTRADARCRRR